jgi:hypothetical protein
MMEKHCIVAGCKQHPCFGLGLPSWRTPMKWACEQHRTELNTAAKGATSTAVNVALPVEASKLRTVGPQPAQGSLL